MNCTIEALLDVTHTLAKPYLEKLTYPWEALEHIGDWVLELGHSLPKEEYEEIAPHVWVAKSAKISPLATLIAPIIIGKNTEVRPGAFLRGNILVGETCVVGNSSELKNCILFDNVQVPHYNYIGDSLLGYKAHMGAGSITSNVKADKSLVVVKTEPPMETGRKKFGAILGDQVEVGCNAVLNPGTVLGRKVSVYPVTCVRGVVEEDTIVKNDGSHHKRK